MDGGGGVDRNTETLGDGVEWQKSPVLVTSHVEKVDIDDVGVPDHAVLNFGHKTL